MVDQTLDTGLQKRNIIQNRSALQPPKFFSPLFIYTSSHLAAVLPLGCLVLPSRPRHFSSGFVCRDCRSPTRHPFLVGSPFPIHSHPSKFASHASCSPLLCPSALTCTVESNRLPFLSSFCRRTTVALASFLERECYRGLVDGW